MRFVVGFLNKKDNGNSPPSVTCANVPARASALRVVELSDVQSSSSGGIQGQLSR